jgi:hypothetical protein
MGVGRAVPGDDAPRVRRELMDDLDLPAETRAFPVFALREGERERTGLILAPAGATISQIAALGDEAAPPFDVDLAQEHLGAQVDDERHAGEHQREGHPDVGRGQARGPDGPIGVPEGRYAYYLYPEDLYAPGLHEYTLMPMHLHSLFTPAEMRTARLVEPFGFTKGMPLLKIDALMDARRIPIHDGETFQDTGTRLYDLEADPRQERPFRNAQIEVRLREEIATELAAHDCPTEIFDRYRIRDVEALPSE